MKALITFVLFCACLNLNAQDTVTIYFDFNSYTLSSEQLIKLKNFPKSDVSIIGISAYCDTVGTSSYNQKLAKRRLNSVLSTLKSKPQKTSLNGEAEAASANNYNAAKARRVDIISTSSSVANAEGEAKTEGQLLLAKKFKEFIDGTEKYATMDLKLLFIPGYPVLIKTSVPEIQELFELLRDNPNVNAHIHGHVCCADDYKLSFDRAVMVRDYLTSRGITKDRLQFSGHSNREPKVTPEVTEEDRLANRRVTVVFKK